MKVSLVLVALIGCALVISISGKSPILIVPGLMGSQLEAKVKSLKCYTFGKYKLLWISPKRILCLHKLGMRLKEGKFEDASKVKVRVYAKSSHFGNTKPVECIYKLLGKCKFEYFKAFIKYFAKKGYGKGTDFRAAAYDWRLSPYELKDEGYFNETKTLIEKMFDENDEKPVTVVGHSYGGLLMLYFLRNEVDQKWKKKYIKAFIPLGSPFGGATKALGALMHGDLPGVDFKIKKLTSMLRSFPSLYFLAPRHDVFQDKVLVKMGTTNYTAENYLNILTYKGGFNKYNTTQNHNKDYQPGDPGVPTYCMYGTGKKTPDRYEESKKGKLKLKKDDRGDGTVNRLSLEVCEKWSKTVTIFPGVNHMQIIKNKAVLKAISDIVLS